MEFHFSQLLLLLFSCQVMSNSLQPHRLQPSLLVPHHRPEFAQVHVYWIGDGIQPSHLLSSSSPFCLQSFLASGSLLALCVRPPKGWNFSFSISPSNEYSGLISFRINWFDLLAVQGTLKSSPALQFEIINASVLCLLYGPTLTWSNSYMTTGKTIASTIWTSVGKVVFLLFNTLSRFVIAFLPRNSCLVISWL